MGILFDVIPVKYRRLAYLLATLALFVYGVWEASNGDWGTFAGSLLTALVTALAAGNSVPVGKEADPSLSDLIADETDDNGPLLPIEYPNDESGTEAVFPNSDTLYQPGEGEGERFGDKTIGQRQFFDEPGVSGNISTHTHADGVWCDECPDAAEKRAAINEQRAAQDLPPL